MHSLYSSQVIGLFLSQFHNFSIAITLYITIELVLIYYLSFFKIFLIILIQPLVIASLTFKKNTADIFIKFNDNISLLFKRKF